MKPSPSPRTRGSSHRRLLAAALAIGLSSALLTLRPLSSLSPFSPSVFSSLETSLSSQPSLGQNASLNSSKRETTPLPIASTAVPPRLLPQKGPIRGNPLVYTPGASATDKGRVATLDRSALPAWKNLQAGHRVQLPSVDESELEGTVHLVTQDDGWLRIGGSLPDGQGNFYLSTNFDEIAGAIHRPESGIGYQIATEPNGELLLIERRLSALICWPGTRGESLEPDREDNLARANAVSDPASNVAISAGGKVPELNTRPGAKGTLYLDFDGEKVTDPAWNGGRTIEAAPSRLTGVQIQEVVARVAEDYAPFDLTVTTLRSEYDKAAAGRRMRIIVTPTETASPGSGGVSLIDSWSRSGRGVSSTVPGWVFTSSTKSIAEAISHEAGHTFGLGHDGTLTQEYYSGHSGSSTTTGWAPIMGNSYSRPLTQWSKGEYARANNQEDDLAIIAKAENGVGYRTDALTVGALPLVGSSFQATGLLTQSTVADQYEFRTLGGAIQASVAPTTAAYTNVDLKLELLDSAGKTVALSAPPEALGAVLNVNSIPSGTYRLVVRSAGTGARPSTGYTVGYSEYGSIGNYTLSGSITGALTVPVFSSASAVSGIVGTQLSFPVRVASSSGISLSSDDLPPGVTWNSTTSTFSGIPTQAGQWTVSLRAAGLSGSTNQELVFNIAEPTVPLATVLGSVSRVTTTPVQTPWVGASATLASGQVGLVAASGRPGNSGSSRLQFTVPGQTVVSFWWKVSSEAGQDILTCRVNGAIAKDTDKGTPLTISGESGWVRQRVILPGTGDQTLEFSYSKDDNLSQGADRGWIYGVEIARPPVFRSISSNPVSRILRTLELPSSQKNFSLTANGEGAATYQWFKDGVALKNSSAEGRQILGATLSTLSITGVTAADAGSYSVNLTNATGTTPSTQFSVTIPGLPQITEQPVAPTGLRVGSSLLLSVKASGTQPMFYLWTRDGTNLQWSTSPVLQISSLRASDAGKYQAWAVNRFGFTKSEEIQLNIATPAQRAKTSAR